MNVALRIELSRRLRHHLPEAWLEFSQLWMSFNALDGGESDHVERSRVMQCIRRAFDEQTAPPLLLCCAPSIDRILQLPPADMRFDQVDPRFRATGERCAALYRDQSASDVERLAAIGGVIYQVRCNLLHGSKDPAIERDRMLVMESLQVLRALVPALDAACQC